MSGHVRTSQGPQIHLGPQGVNKTAEKRQAPKAYSESLYNARYKSRHLLSVDIDHEMDGTNTRHRGERIAWQTLVDTIADQTKPKVHPTITPGYYIKMC